MATRLQLQAKLEELLGVRRVYFQPKDGTKLEYPCIIYQRAGKDQQHADDSTYTITQRYTITIISREHTDPVTDEILRAFPMADYDRTYISNNLYHDVINLYY